jgi:hypothetical protein
MSDDIKYFTSDNYNPEVLILRAETAALRAEVVKLRAENEALKKIERQRWENVNRTFGTSYSTEKANNESF